MQLRVLLPPAVEAIIQQKVGSGAYHSADDVIQDAVYLLDGFDRLRSQRDAVLRQALAASRAQAGHADATLVLDYLRADAERLARHRS